MKNNADKRNSNMKTGIDIIEIERIKPELNFLNRILVQKEMEYAKKYDDPSERIAGFFCAKEAVFKALDMKVCNYKDIEIDHNKNGRPLIILHGATLKHFNKNYNKIDVSISHSKTIASAICIVE